MQLHKQNVKRGDKLRCLYAGEYSEYLTLGKVYQVEAGVGDEDIACGGLVEDFGFNVIDDDGDAIYCLTDDTSDEGWELVTNDK